jgi:3',5'-cyclic AMP phosphodiesterase CpdA
MVIFHASDLQIGTPFRPSVAEAFVAQARAVEPDLVVISGDLTQRAKEREFVRARAIMDELAPLPVVVTPGNHDVPLFRAFERAFVPYRNWTRFVGVPLDSVTSLPGATVVALNSSAPRRALVAGRLRARQVAFARRAFDEASATDVRIMVTHHHFVPTPDGLGGRPLPGGAALLGAFEAMGVELVLGGHVHRTHLRTSRELVPGDGPGIPLLACGTTASSRGRGPEAGLNSLNIVRVDRDEVVVTPHLCQEGATRFLPTESVRFPRRGFVAGPEGATA